MLYCLKVVRAGCAWCADDALEGCGGAGNYGHHLWIAGYRDGKGKAFVWKVKDSNSDSYVSYPMTYTSWLKREPNNFTGLEACVAVTQKAGYRHWNDQQCTKEFCFVCQLET